ncbi:EthD family reductase [Bacillus sp. BGMRC 2118]|nr:EthD family reductase [Bacillus sp. BGMRC 2118]
MAKLIVMYNQPSNQAGFEEYYHNVHIPLVQKLPHLTGAEVHRVLQVMNTTNESLFLIAELHFESPETLNHALSSPEGMEVQGDVKNLMPYLTKPPVIAIVD